MVSPTCLLVLLAACGRIGFSPVEDSAVSQLGPFGAPAVIADLAHPALDDDPSLTGDLVEIYFDSTRSGVDTVWRARRATPESSWDAPEQLVGLTGQDHDPGIAPDGLSMFVSSDRIGGLGQDDIWMTTRADRAAAWSDASLVAELSSAERDSVPQATADGLTLFFSSTRITGSFDLFVVTRSTTSEPWGIPEPVVELNTAATEIDPHFCEVEDTLYFASNRSGGSGSRDIYRARRTGTWTFAVPEPVGELNTPEFDSDPWLSPDGRMIFFVNDSSGNREIMMAVR